MPLPRFVRSFCYSAFGFDPSDPPCIRRHDRDMRRFIDDAVRRGASYSQLAQEYRLRVALAELRRRASDWVMQEPHSAAQAIASVSESIRERLSKIDAGIFTATVSGLSRRDLLYPEARKAAEQADTAASFTTRRRRPSADEVSAVMRVR